MRRSAAEILTLLKRNAQAIRSHGVRRLGLFGSAARGTAEEESDPRRLKSMCVTLCSGRPTR